MPLHVQLIIILSTGSVILCLLLGLFGYLLSKGKNALPPVPQFPGSNFPGAISTLCTIGIGLIFIMTGVSGYMQQGGSEDSGTMSLYVMLVSAAIQIALYLPFICIYMQLPSREMPPVSTARKLGWIIFFLLLMVVPGHIMELMKLPEWIAENTGAPVMQDVVTTIRDGNTDIRIAMVLMAVIVAPITEEIYFRGFVYNILKKWSGPVPAALASSFFFAIIHTSLSQTIPLTLFALVQCWAYEKSRSIWLPITLHMLFNGINCFAILFLM